MKYKLLLILTLIGFWEISIAQKEDNIWYFGNQAGLDFTSGTPIALTNGALFTYDNSSTVSDSAGNLLFYTNGVTVWNKNHVAMANGTGLLGNNSGGQSALIVRQPNSQIYYIFTTGAFNGSNGFRYSTVDITLNGGLGDVVQKNILLFSPSTEKIDGIYNCSDNSFWIISHTWNSNQFNAYKLSTTGLNTTPVTSNVGSVHSGGSPSGYNAIGQLTLSHDGTKLACGIYSMGNIEIFDFDINTGIVSNPIIITGYSSAFGVAFSPDSKRLYLTNWYGKNITQFDVSLGTQAAIASSATVVGMVTGPGTSGYYVGYLQLAPDNKIYAAVYDDDSLAVINNPNVLGTNCNFVDAGVYLGGKTSLAGLSRVLSIGFSYTYVISSICSGDSIFLQGNYQTASGTYYDTLQTINCYDSIIETALTINSTFLINTSVTICSEDSAFLQGNYQTSSGIYYDTLQTISGCDSIVETTLSILQNTDSVLNETACNGYILNSQTYTSSGTYTQALTNTDGCDSVITLNLVILNSTSATLNEIACDSYTLNSTSYTSNGTYTQTLINTDGCDSIITLNLTIYQSTVNNQQLSICNGDSIPLQGNYQTVTGIYYDTLSTVNGCDSIITSNLTVSSFLYDTVNASICANDSFFVQGAYQTLAGNYNDTISSANICDSIKTTVLTVIQAPSVTVNASPNVICSGDTVTLTAVTTASSLQWNTGDTTFFIRVNPEAGTNYYLIASDRFCNASDSVFINVFSLPVVTASPDTTIYLSDNAFIGGSSQSSGEYLWFPEEGLSCTVCQNTVAGPNETTTYYVKITDTNGCSNIDSVTVFVETDCGTISVPNIFSPNADGNNDILYVHGTCIQSLSFIVYDRWGEKVFETNDKSIGWDGSYKGNKLNSAVFAYSLKVIFLNNREKVLKGNITLIK